MARVSPLVACSRTTLHAIIHANIHGDRLAQRLCIRPAVWMAATRVVAQKVVIRQVYALAAASVTEKTAV